MLLITFIVSLCMLALLLGVKMYEVKRNERALPLRFLSQFDGHVERRVKTAQGIYQKERRRATDFLQEDLPRQSKQAIVVFVEAAWKKYHSVFPNVRGVRTLRTDRDASEFLQTISSDRSRDGKGSIEDNSIAHDEQQVPKKSK